jgi:hypothetical protein
MLGATRIGFVGCPPEEQFSILRKRYASIEWIDLDNAYPRIEPVSSSLLPANVCAIIKRIVDNAVGLKLDSILFDAGYGKCDHARAVGHLLSATAKVPLIFTHNDNLQGHGTPISDSALPPFEKAERILAELTNLGPPPQLPACEPPAAIWGVPAADFEIYRLFPNGTRLLGWFRCLENRTPANDELELEVDPQVPTIFFAQTFCHKNILAKDLARRFNGLYVDMDGVLTQSTRAKIETFLRFNVRR